MKREKRKEEKKGEALEKKEKTKVEKKGEKERRRTNTWRNYKALMVDK